MTGALTKQIATIGMVLIITLTIAFHLSIILGVVPFEMVWGGRLKSHSQMLSFETASIAMNLVILAVVAIYAGILKIKASRKVIRVALWAMFILFLLNTVGNMLSENQTEKLLFTPVTLLLAIFSLRLAASKETITPVDQV